MAFRNFAALVLCGMAAVTLTTSSAARSPISDAQIKQRLIQASIASYPGTCACPYNSARNGSSCGGRSAWSRGGGYSPLCYPRDVSNAEVVAWRASH